MKRILTWVFAGLLAVGVRGEEGEEDWAGKLGSADFAERTKAELALRAGGRGSLPALRVAIESEDPQVRLTAQRILDFILSDPANIPMLFRSLVPGPAGEYAKETEAWRAGTKVGDSNVDGRAGTSGNFAQSFVPGCGRISAIEVCTYPLANAHGWLRLDLCRDDGGEPSKTVLGRSWVYAPKGHGFPHGGYLLYEFEPVEVKPGELMWMVHAGFGDADSDQNLTNYGLSFQVDDYPAGKLWRNAYPDPKGDEDVNFRIFEKVERHPKYREATEEDRRSFPAAEAANMPWSGLLLNRRR